MPINFPNSPATNEIYSYDTKSWIWSGSYWSSLGSTNFVVGSTGNVTSVNGCTGILGITGTTGEIEVTSICPNIVIGLPNNVTISENLNVGGDIQMFGSIYIDGGTF